MSHCTCCEDRVQGALESAEHQLLEYELILKAKDEEIAKLKQRHEKDTKTVALQGRLITLYEEKIAFFSQRVVDENRRRLFHSN